MKILVLTDNPTSWYIPFGNNLINELVQRGHNAKYIMNKTDIESCDICFLLSCTKIVEMKFLQNCNKTIVIHGSDLPLGKGFSPVQWQILEGSNIIPITLLEAAEQVDSGRYFFKENLILEGHELLNEIRIKLANLINAMALSFVDGVSGFKSQIQIGPESFYPRRTEKDDELNIDKSIREHFNHLRIADNDNYPLYFNFRGHRYLIKIEKDNKRTLQY